MKVRAEKGAKNNALEISGNVPENAKAGDVLLVNVTATYPRNKKRAARTIDFLEFVHVGKPKK